MTLAAVRAAVIACYLPPAAAWLQQTSCTPLPLSIDGTDRQTDRRTEGHPTVSTITVHYGASANKSTHRLNEKITRQARYRIRVCSVPRQNGTFGDRSFAAAGPRAWNELPFNLRYTALSLTVFNAHLKTHLFSILCGATAHL